MSHKKCGARLARQISAGMLCTTVAVIGFSSCLVDELCFSDSDCNPPEICLFDRGGVCGFECTRDADCGDALVCQDHRCATRAEQSGDASTTPLDCPPDMVNVGDSFCVDRHEASRADATEGDAGEDDQVATSRPGVMPWRVADNEAAQAACVAAGKRLCTPTEWRLACEGSRGSTYGYGEEYEPSTCNGIDTFGTSGFRLLPTGSMPGCTSDWGAFDLNGNLWEHTLGGSDQTVRGGAYNCIDSRLLHRCDYVPGDWTPSARGFRCCVVPEPDSDSSAGSDGSGGAAADDASDDFSQGAVDDDASVSGDGSSLDDAGSELSASGDSGCLDEEDAGPDAAEPDAAGPTDAGEDSSLQEDGGEAAPLQAGGLVDGGPLPDDGGYPVGDGSASEDASPDADAPDAATDPTDAAEDASDAGAAEDGGTTEDGGTPADAAPPDAALACPSDMVLISDFCMDIYEASHADATAITQGSSAVAASQPGVMPWYSLSATPAEALATARSACAEAGKRLCTLDEWIESCAGPEGRVYGYGDEYLVEICNGIDTFCLCDSELCSSADPCPYPHCWGECGATFHAVPTGSFTDCQNAFSVLDINGNVWELTDTTDGLAHYRGGAYNCSDSEALHRCDHDGSWNPSARGFRCCRDPL
jgi:formylglycine-generating enzyme required for sulfatase activity